MQLTKLKPEAAAIFVKEIVTKANGVFLWIQLVVKSLLNGLKNRDDISDLRQRLEECPQTWMICTDIYWIKSNHDIWSKQIAHLRSIIQLRKPTLE